VTSPVFSTVLLVVLALVMFGLGLGLVFADFALVATSPRAVVVTLASQTLLLPAVCFGLVLALGLSPTTSLGMMLLAASPGGPMSSVFSHLAGGDVALNVTVTAVNALLSLITMPLITVFALGYFLPATTAVSVPADKIVQVFAVVLIPVAIGMVVRRRAPGAAARMQRPVRVAAVVAVTLAIIGSIGQQFDFFLLGLARIGFVVITFSVLSLGLGYLVPRLFRIGHRQAVAAGLEIGIHNAVVAITVAVSVLGIPAASFAPALYGALMFVPASVFAWLVSRRRPAGITGRDTEIGTTPEGRRP
jgi:BASS family bile acid:Na+ symporter